MNYPEFYGSVTVGERGQIVLPAKMREDLAIDAGDKLLVFAGPGTQGALILKPDFMNDMLEKMSKAFRESMEED